MSRDPKAAAEEIFHAEPRREIVCSQEQSSAVSIPRSRELARNQEMMDVGKVRFEDGRCL
jgi:hypothetical protein